MSKEFDIPHRSRRLVKKALARHNRAELARQIGVTRAAVHHWYTTGYIPAERVRALESLLGLPDFEIRPDIFKRPEQCGEAAQ